ncbi:MAG: SDR family oxidoreductase [Neomegalonema sp.]|nr:SDR family oxidoreductase [Neomegalonema sp.]
MKRALITGGSSPIGAACARALAEAGRHVVLHANRNLDKAQMVAQEIGAAGGSANALALDLLDPAAQAKLAEIAEAEPFEILVHCVGGQRDMPFAAMDWEDWSAVIDLNLNTLFGALRPLILPMMRQRWGRIVAVSSLTAVTGNRGQANYAAAKGGMLPFVKSLTREYGSRGITANVVAPGLIETKETRQLANYDDLCKLAACRRAGTVEEVAALIAFLTSEPAGYISGQLICVDGGTT